MKISAIIAIAAALLMGLVASTFVVREDQTALVLNLGNKVVRYDLKPGLHFKWPLVETVRTFDRRYLVLETKPDRVFTSEQKDVSVDFFIIGYIADSRAFYRATNGDQSVAADRLAPIVTASLRNQINSRTLQQLVSGDRNEIVAGQLQTINAATINLGMQIVDIRIKQIELATDGGSRVIDEVYERMKAQRQQVANKSRAEGEEQARTIRAQADRDQAVLVAEAERDAQRLRGEGDAEAARIYASAAASDPAFFAFYRSLEAYRASFADGNSVIVLDKNDPFLQYLRSDR
jgi:membrane protease subunit HflC